MPDALIEEFRLKPARQEFPNDEALATWWRQETEGTNYWRCQVPAKHLPGQVLALNVYDLKDEEMPRQKGAAIWQYPGNTTLAILLSVCQEMGRKTLIEVDDNYLVPAPHIAGYYSAWQNLNDPNSGESSHEIHRKIVRFADGIICATDQLARQYEKLNENVFVCPNSVDPDDWGYEKPDDGVFRIGYSASTSHLYDLSLVQRALDWASLQDGVEIVCLGHPPRGITGNVRHIPWTNTLADYRESLFQLDVGVCPLKPSLWANCKSDVKAMEYAMAGALAVFSREIPYKLWFDRPGIACETPKDFLKALKWCVKNRDEVRDVAAQAKQYVLDERTIDKSIHLWREAIR